MKTKRVALVLFCIVILAVSSTLGGCSMRKSTDIENEIIEFGMYPQTILSDEAVISALNTGITGGTIAADSTTGWYAYGGKQYAAVAAKLFNTYSFSNEVEAVEDATYYFIVEPIKSAVLEDGDGSRFLLSLTALDADLFDVSYNEEDTEQVKPITSSEWASSDIRAWLNDYFYNSAFSVEERGRVLLTQLDNTTTNYDNAYAGEDTGDNVFLLSYADVINTDYGFLAEKDNKYSALRCAINNDYTKAKGGFASRSWAYSENGDWWLRSAGSTEGYPSIVTYQGGVGNLASRSYRAYNLIRPAIYLSDI
jgi:hypothetical protein